MKFRNRIGMMIPLVFSLSSNASHFQPTELRFSESDVKNNLIDIDSQIFNFAKGDYEASGIYLKERFIKLKEAWLRDTRFSNSMTEIINDKNFKSIVNMGDSAIPLILESLKEEPSHLVWALNLITNANISNTPKTTISEASRLWVKWGKASGIIF